MVVWLMIFLFVGFGEKGNLMMMFLLYSLD